MKIKTDSSPRLDYVVCLIPALFLGMSTSIAMDHQGSWFVAALLLASLAILWHLTVSRLILRDPKAHKAQISLSGPQPSQSITLWHNMLGRGVTSFLSIAAFGPIIYFFFVEPFCPFPFVSSIPGFIVAGVGFVGWQIRIYYEVKQR